MKAMTCEMCNGTEFVKEDGFFVCQFCGIKYSVEEAKKMMIEGTVDVQGTVKVDNSAFVEKYLTNARRAYEKEDWEEVEKYYNMVEQNDPTNIEAIFYSAFGKAKTSLTSDDIYKRQAAFKVLQNSVSIIDDNYNMEKEPEQFVFLEKITNDIINMSFSSYVFTEWKDGYGNVTKTNKSETESLFVSLLDEYAVSLQNIIAKYELNQKSKIKSIYMWIIKLYEIQRDSLNLTAQGKDICNKNIVKMHEQIKKIEPEHIIPSFSSAVEEEKQKGIMKTAIIVICIIIGIICFGVWYYNLLMSSY